MKVRPGNYADYLASFRALSAEELAEKLRWLPESGCGWPTANYRRALERAINEREVTRT